MKVFFSILIFYLSQSFNIFADVKFSDYNDYEITKINFQLEEISKGLNYPWGMTFIDEENFLITEKNGRLLKTITYTPLFFPFHLKECILFTTLYYTSPSIPFLTTKTFYYIFYYKKT